MTRCSQGKSREHNTANCLQSSITLAPSQGVLAAALAETAADMSPHLTHEVAFIKTSQVPAVVMSNSWLQKVTTEKT